MFMEKQKSFSKIEQVIRHTFRNNLNIAESDEDAKKFFAYAVKDLTEQASEGQVSIESDDICLDQDAADGFTCSKRLKRDKIFMELWNNSDLAHIVTRLAENALNRIKHLEERHPDKSEAKIYPTPSHSGQRFSNRPAKK
jgi:hypothetical protein